MHINIDVKKHTKIQFWHTCDISLFWRDLPIFEQISLYNLTLLKTNPRGCDNKEINSHEACVLRNSARQNNTLMLI